jgi:dTDP-4-dehydrorhamnose reductase
MDRRVAITGAGGQLGRRLVQAFSAAGDDVLPLTRSEVDITDAGQLERLASWRPDVVVNAAAWTDVDGCARDPVQADRINGTGAENVARIAAAAGALAVQISTNEVFDGASNRPYTEEDATNPVNPYGASKLLAERLVAEAAELHLIVRTAWLHDPIAGSGFPARIRAAADGSVSEGRALRVVADEWGNPTSAAWLATALAYLLELRPEMSGIIHLAGWPPTSRHQWARAILGDSAELTPITLGEFTRDSTVPPRAVLDVSRARAIGIEPHDWRRPIAGADL